MGSSEWGQHSGQCSGGLVGGPSEDPGTQYRGRMEHGWGHNSVAQGPSEDPSRMEEA